MTSEAQNIEGWFRGALAAKADRVAGLHHAYQSLENAGLINRLVLQRYRCRRGTCEVATVIRVEGFVLCRTSDYKLSPGMNTAQSVESARRKNTLDGNRHWPGHTFDVADLASDAAVIEMNCRHQKALLLATDVLAAVSGATPGHPRRPILL